MGIYGGGSSYDQSSDLAIDANASTITSAIEIGDTSMIGVYVQSASGTHGTHVLTIQLSPDGNNWFDSTHTITGLGNLHEITCVALNARCKITTVEGATSTIDVFLITR